MIAKIRLDEKHYLNSELKAVDIDKSYSWVKAVHGSGLANLQKILNGKEGK